ncbi:MAG: type II toxin-antitoxin system prevent-host-death family antitoxin [Microbacterium sp.]
MWSQPAPTPGRCPGLSASRPWVASRIRWPTRPGALPGTTNVRPRRLARAPDPGRVALRVRERFGARAPARKPPTHPGGAQRRATLCDIDTVSHREMRNRSGEILRRVEAGESVQVTNNGRVAALIVPPTSGGLDDLIERGQARGALTGVEAMLAVEPVVSPLTSGQLVDEARGHW